MKVSYLIVLITLVYCGSFLSCNKPTPTPEPKPVLLAKMQFKGNGVLYNCDQNENQRPYLDRRRANYTGFWLSGGSDSCYVNFSLCQDCGAVLEGTYPTTTAATDLYCRFFLTAVYIPTITSKYTVNVTSSKDGLVSGTFSATMLPNDPSNPVMEITEGTFSNVAILPN